MFDKKTNTYIGYIYVIKNDINDKLYIGQTRVSLKRRFNGHLQKSRVEKPKTVISKAIKKYGESHFYIEELLHVHNSNLDELVDDLNFYEIFMINKYETTVDKGGYNVSLGGDVFKGLAKKIDVYSEDGDFIVTFDSVSSAAEYYNTNVSSISNVCLGKHPRHLDMIFRFHGDSFDKYKTSTDVRRRIYQFSKNGELLNIFHGTKEIYDNIGIWIKANAIGNPWRTFGGYWWSYNNIFNYQGNYHESPIDVYTMSGILIGQYHSMAEFARIGKYEVKSISKVCSGQKANYKKLVFRYMGESFNKYPIAKIVNPIHNTKSVNQYSKNGEFIKTYKCISDATRCFTDKPSSSINMCCSKKYDKSTAYGYFWYYANDPDQPDKTKIIVT